MSISEIPGNNSPESLQRLGFRESQNMEIYLMFPHCSGCLRTLQTLKSLTFESGLKKPYF